LAGTRLADAQFNRRSAASGGCYLRRQIAVTGDDELRELERELPGYAQGMGVTVRPPDAATAAALYERMNSGPG
jgi:hypothetical protein